MTGDELWTLDEVAEYLEPHEYRFDRVRKKLLGEVRRRLGRWGIKETRDGMYAAYYVRATAEKDRAWLLAGSPRWVALEFVRKSGFIPREPFPGDPGEPWRSGDLKTPMLLMCLSCGSEERLVPSEDLRCTTCAEADVLVKELEREQQAQARRCMTEAAAATQRGDHATASRLYEQVVQELRALAPETDLFLKDLTPEQKRAAVARMAEAADAAERGDEETASTLHDSIVKGIRASCANPDRVTHLKEGQRKEIIARMAQAAADAEQGDFAAASAAYEELVQGPRFPRVPGPFEEEVRAEVRAERARQRAQALEDARREREDRKRAAEERAARKERERAEWEAQAPQRQARAKEMERERAEKEARVRAELAVPSEPLPPLDTLTSTRKTPVTRYVRVVREGEAFRLRVTTTVDPRYSTQPSSLLLDEVLPAGARPALAAGEILHDLGWSLAPWRVYSAPQWARLHKVYSSWEQRTAPAGPARVTTLSDFLAREGEIGVQEWDPQTPDPDEADHFVTEVTTTDLVPPYYIGTDLMGMSVPQPDRAARELLRGTTVREAGRLRRPDTGATLPGFARPEVLGLLRSRAAAPAASETESGPDAVRPENHASPLMPLRSRFLARQLGARSDAPHDTSRFYPLTDPDSVRSARWETPDAYAPRPAPAPGSLVARTAVLTRWDEGWGLRVAAATGNGTEVLALVTEDDDQDVTESPADQGAELLRSLGWQTTTWEPLAEPGPATGAPGLRMNVISPVLPLHEVAYQHLGTTTKVWQEAARTTIRKTGVRPLGAYAHQETSEPVPVCVLGEALATGHTARVLTLRADAEKLRAYEEWLYRYMRLDEIRRPRRPRQIPDPRVHGYILVTSPKEAEFQALYAQMPEGAERDTPLTRTARARARSRFDAEFPPQMGRMEIGEPRPYDGLTRAQILAALLNNTRIPTFEEKLDGYQEIEPLDVEAAGKLLARLPVIGEGDSAWVALPWYRTWDLALRFDRDHWASGFDRYQKEEGLLERVIAHLRATGDVGRLPGN